MHLVDKEITYLKKLLYFLLVITFLTTSYFRTINWLKSSKSNHIKLSLVLSNIKLVAIITTLPYKFDHDSSRKEQIFEMTKNTVKFSFKKTVLFVLQNFFSFDLPFFNSNLKNCVLLDNETNKLNIERYFKQSRKSKCSKATQQCLFNVETYKNKTISPSTTMSRWIRNSQINRFLNIPKMET